MKKVLLIYVVLIAAIAIWWLVAEQEWSHDGAERAKGRSIGCK